MEFFGKDITEIPFAPRAKALQAKGQTAGLVRDLGDNYGEHHAHLAAELERVGRPTVPKHSTLEEALAGYDDYVARWTYVEQIVTGEAILRVCRAHRQDGARLVAVVPDGPPLVQDDRLVSFE